MIKTNDEVSVEVSVEELINYQLAISGYEAAIDTSLNAIETYQSTLASYALAMSGYQADLASTVDTGSNLININDATPLWTRYTSPLAYTVFAPNNTAYDEGGVLDVRGYNTLNIYYSKTASTADDNYIKFNGLLTSDATVDYQQTSFGTPTAGVQAVSENLYQIGSGAAVNMLTVPLNGIPYCRFDFAKVTDNGTDSTFTTYYNLAWT